MSKETRSARCDEKMSQILVADELIIDGRRPDALQLHPSTYVVLYVLRLWPDALMR